LEDKSLNTVSLRLLQLELQYQPLQSTFDNPRSSAAADLVVPLPDYCCGQENFAIKNYSNKVQRNILRKKGWTTEEINQSEVLFLCSKFLSEGLISPFWIMNVMLIRYILVLSKINGNEKVKVILNNIITEKITKQLSNTIVTDIDNTYSNLVKEKISFVTDFMEKYYDNRFTHEEVGGLLSSLFEVLDVPCDTM
jgi:hypothetical protein